MASGLATRTYQPSHSPLSITAPPFEQVLVSVGALGPLDNAVDMRGGFAVLKGNSSLGVNNLMCF